MRVQQPRHVAVREQAYGGHTHKHVTSTPQKPGWKERLLASPGGTKGKHLQTPTAWQSSSWSPVGPHTTHTNMACSSARARAYHQLFCCGPADPTVSTLHQYRDSNPAESRRARYARSNTTHCCTLLKHDTHSSLCCGRRAAYACVCIRVCPRRQQTISIYAGDSVSVYVCIRVCPGPLSVCPAPGRQHTCAHRDDHPPSSHARRVIDGKNCTCNTVTQC